MRIKPAISQKRLKDKKATITINSLYKVVHGLSITTEMGMTLNDVCARFRVIDSLHAMAKYSLVMTPMPCRVAGCIMSVRRRYSCTRALTCTYLLTYLHS